MEKKISPVQAISIFTIATLYFYALLFTLLPFLKHNFIINPALYWFIVGYFLFIPLFATAVIMVRLEGSRTFRQILSALNIRPFSTRDWAYSLAGLVLAFGFSGLVFGVSSLLNTYCAVAPLNMTPWFMEMRPFHGSERLLLLVWFPMFFFNISGEEFLWRGYIQKRLQMKRSWMICSLLWLMFHLPFGVDLLAMLVPVIIIIPYAFYKTENTSVGIFIHALYNGPVFIALALGVIT